MMNRELNLASLLVDFERFYQKSSVEFVDCYQGLFGKFYDVEKVKRILTAVSSGDASFEEAKILLEARRLSLMESVETKGHTTVRNLCTVFSRVRMMTSEEYKPLRYPIAPKTQKVIFPSDSPEGSLEDHIGSFDQEMELLSETTEDYRVFCVQFLNLLERYL